MTNFYLYFIPLTLFSIVFFFEGTSKGFLQRKNVFFSVLVFYQLIVTTWIGAWLVAADILSPPRLDLINSETKLVIYLWVSYATLVLVFGLYLFINLFKVKRTSITHLSNDFALKSRVFLFLRALTLLLFIYVTFKYLIFYSKSPLIMTFNGDFVGAALTRAQIQKRELQVDIPYLGKFFYFLSFYIPTALLCLYLKYKDKNTFLVFALSLSLALLNLLFDIQKAPLAIFSLVFLAVYMSYGKIKLSFFLKFLVLIVTIVFAYAAITGKDGSIYIVLNSIFDRLLVGQNQGMYYFYEYYEPSLQGVFSDLPMSEYLGVREAKPDELILNYIYSDMGGLVNTNTFFMGEAWAFFSWSGVILSPLVVLVVLCFYIIIFNKMINKNELVYWPAALIFFTTLPINQSLQFIIYQKYFLYYFVFLLLPIFFIYRYKLSMRLP